MIKNYIYPIGWLLDANKRWLRHLLFWIINYIDVIFSVLGITDPLGMPFGRFAVVHLLPDFFLVYISILLLVPVFLFRGRIFWFVLLTLISLLFYSGFTFIYDYFEGTIPTADEMSPFTFFLQWHLLDGVQLMAKAVGLKVFLQYISNLQKLKELENQNLNTELSYLKSQVHPHFLFNILNNIAVLSEKYPDKVTDAIIQLSKVLRYQLYEGQKEYVPLVKEIENLKNYLDLERMRKNKSTIRFEVNGDPQGILVAPFLFLPFFENAIKHGINHQGETNIEVLFDIHLELIIFTIVNGIPPHPPVHIAGGIGLKNIRRRLELIYPHHHELDIDENNNLYTVKLTLKPVVNEMYYSG